MIVFWGQRQECLELARIDGDDFELHRAEGFLQMIKDREGTVISDGRISRFLIQIRNYFRFSESLVGQQGVRKEDIPASWWYFHFFLLNSMAKSCPDINIATSQRDYVAEMIRCTTNMMPFFIKAGNTTDALLGGTYKEILMNWYTKTNPKASLNTRRT